MRGGDGGQHPGQLARLSESAAAGELTSSSRIQPPGFRTAGSFFKRLSEFTRELANKQTPTSPKQDRVIRPVMPLGTPPTVRAKEAAALFRSYFSSPFPWTNELDQLTRIVQEASDRQKHSLTGERPEPAAQDEDYASSTGQMKKSGQAAGDERRKGRSGPIRDARLSGNLDLLKQLGNSSNLRPVPRRKSRPIRPQGPTGAVNERRPSSSIKRQLR